MLRKVPVLVYHAVNALPAAGLERFTISPPRFREHVRVVQDSGRLALTISELAECLRGERELDRDAVALTFDDGYADTQDAVGELVARGIGATVYVTTGTIGSAGMLSPEELCALAAFDGVEVGAHSVTHHHLDELSGAVLDWETAGSKRTLEAVLGAPVTSFAYPHGSHDRRSRAAVVRAGYSSAAAVKNAISHLDDDPFAIARWIVTSGTPAERIAAVLRGESLPVAWRRERLRTRAYRAARRARRHLPVGGPT